MSLSAVPTGRPKARYAAKRDAIIAAAAAVFNEEGANGFTLAAVARRMDLHPVSLTYYFKHKDDLAAACLMDTFGRIGALLDEAEQEATPEARLRRFVTVYFDVRRRIALRELPQLAPLGEARQVGGEQHPEVMQAFVGVLKRIGWLFKDESRPWLDRARRQLLTQLTIEQMFWTGGLMGAYEPSDYPRVGERLADIMINGLAPRGAGLPKTPLLELGPPLGANDEVTRERFLIAATELINREGYRGASVDKISAHLSVTKGSFYHHNTDKDGLAFACFERTFALIEEARRKAAAAPTGWERLWLAAASLAVRQAVGGPGRMLRNYALAAVPSDMRAQLHVRLDRIAHAFAGIISDGIADGSIRPVDPAVASHMVMAMFNSALPMRVPEGRPVAETMRDDYARPLFMGFFSPPPAR